MTSFAGSIGQVIRKAKEYGLMRGEREQSPSISRSRSHRLWLHVTKYGQRFKHLEVVLCVRKTFVSYWLVVSCKTRDGRALSDS